ncbi:MAG: FAD:protein FMN transferase [Lachnospiraceae bacterium]|nr:FAD:protein FMN transferase [Lachnospiraceae bacterium]
MPENNEKNIIKRRAVFMIVITVVIIAVGFALMVMYAGGKKLTKITSYGFNMNTALTLNFFVPEKEADAYSGEDGKNPWSEDIKSLVGRLDRKVLSRRSQGSEVYAFNEWQSTEKFEVSEELYSAVVLCQDIAEKSHGAGDITLGNLIVEWGIEDIAEKGTDVGREEGIEETIVPTKEELDAAAATIGYEHLTAINENGKYYLQKDIPYLTLDLGAAGKGYALDKVWKYLKNQDTETLNSAVIALGGSILVYGSRTSKIGIQDPLSDGMKQMGVLTISGLGKNEAAFVSTSGDYEQYVEEKNESGVIKKYHHILDPDTLYPADTGLRSVTVIAKNGLISDMLSTACYVLGMEESVELLAEYECEAIFIAKDNKVYCTSGVIDSFKIENDTFVPGGALN